LSLKAANEIEEFRYRIEGNKAYCYDSVGAGPTIFREDETYGCGYMPYNENIAEFMKQATAEVKRVKAERGLKFPYAGEDNIHYSTIPWADFTAINHARRLDVGRSIPKITRNGNNMWMPVDIHANHAVMDGYHVGQFIKRFQELLNQE
jgi:chloramphenicol O-acetyltransferase type A